MNMIGKKSKQDWQEAPEGTTHIKLYACGSKYWYKFDNDIKWYWSKFDSDWDITTTELYTQYIFISKQEDLGMTSIKQVSKIEELKELSK